MIHYLEMLDRKQFAPSPAMEGFRVERIEPASPDVNRDFYMRVGKQWQWTDLRNWTMQQWTEYATQPTLSTWLGYQDHSPIGYFELLREDGGSVNIAYFGLLPESIGRGMGKALLTSAIGAAWSLPDTNRVWLHTCTKDHPHALKNYMSRGFQVFRTTEDDERA